MKTYVIILSEKFPTTHPRKGQETEFGRSFLNGKKIHTIRGNFPLWEKRLKEVQEGRAVLSVRQWTGVPYRSPQKELRRLTKEDGIGVQKVVFGRSQWEENDGKLHSCFWANVDGRKEEINLEDIASNDGFSGFLDFILWIEPSMNRQTPDNEGWIHKELAIIHFTKFRY